MNLGQYLPANNLFILISVLLVALFVYWRFMRKKSNRHPMRGPRGRALDEARARDNAQRIIDPPATRR
jgi:hypothetical protein